MKNIFKNPLFYLCLVLVLIAGSMVVNFVNAKVSKWSEPTKPFPDGLTEMPIDTGEEDQIKTGGLTLEKLTLEKLTLDGDSFNLDKDKGICLEKSSTDPAPECNIYWDQITGLWTKNGDDVYYNKGKVGINDSSPDYDLDVAGNINFSGSLLKEGTPFSPGGSSDLGFDTDINFDVEESDICVFPFCKISVSKHVDCRLAGYKVLSGGCDIISGGDEDTAYDHGITHSKPDGNGWSCQVKGFLNTGEKLAVETWVVCGGMIPSECVNCEYDDVCSQTVTNCKKWCKKRDTDGVICKSTGIETCGEAAVGHCNKGSKKKWRTSCDKGDKACGSRKEYYCNDGTCSDNQKPKIFYCCEDEHEPIDRGSPRIR